MLEVVDVLDAVVVAVLVPLAVLDDFAGRGCWKKVMVAFCFFPKRMKAAAITTPVAAVTACGRLQQGTLYVTSPLTEVVVPKDMSMGVVCSITGNLQSKE